MLSLEQKLEVLVTQILDVEKKIAAQKITKAYVQQLQRNLDMLDARIETLEQTVDRRKYARMLELQSLLHYTTGKIDDAKQFASSAASYSNNNLVSNLAQGLVTVSAPEPTTAQTTVDVSVIPEYFTVSTKRLVILSIITLSTYIIYWAYKNWAAIKQTLRENGDNSVVLPRISALLIPLTGYDLFTRVRKSHEHLGLDPKFVPAGSYGWAVFLTNIVSLAFIPIAMFQKYMNAVKERAFGDALVRSGTSIGEVLFVLIAMIAMGIIFTNAYNEGSYDSYENPALQTIRTQADDLSNQYDACSSNLIEREKVLDKSSQAQVDQYNNELAQCEEIRLRQNAVVEDYYQAAGAN